MKHYSQIRVYGKIFERTIFDKNVFVKKNTYIEIIIFDIKHKEKKRTKIDITDYDVVKNIKWHARLNKCSGKFYIQGQINGKKVQLSRLLLNAPKNLMVDHKNLDTLDNRRKNIRLCTRQENSRNKLCRKDSKTGYKGVTYHPTWNRYTAKIKANGISKHLGSFKTAKEASKVYNIEAKKIFGEFCPKL